MNVSKKKYTKIKKTNLQEIDLDLKNFINVIKKFKLLIIFLTSVGIIISSVYNEKRQNIKSIKFELFTPSVEEFIIFNNPRKLQKEFSKSIVNNIINRDWKFNDKYSKKYEKLFDNFEIKFIQNRAEYLKFNSKFFPNDKSSNSQDVNKKLLLNYLNVVFDMTKEQFKKKYQVDYKNRILLLQESLEIANASRIANPPDSGVTSFTQLSDLPDYYKGYNVLKMEIKHLRKRLNVMSNFEFPIRLKFEPLNHNLGDFKKPTYVIGGGLLGFFTALLLLSLISIKNRY